MGNHCSVQNRIFIRPKTFKQRLSLQKYIREIVSYYTVVAEKGFMD